MPLLRACARCKTLAERPVKLPTGWAACPGHADSRPLLENAIDAAATETHLRTERPEVSCRTWRREQACEAQACETPGQMESAGIASWAPFNANVFLLKY
jgi:hypothetical protein